VYIQNQGSKSHVELLSYNNIVGSHSRHMHRAHDLCEPRICTVSTAAENTRTRHPPTNNAYVLQYSDTCAR
jgi:hypothetical protein